MTMWRRLSLVLLPLVFSTAFGNPRPGNTVSFNQDWRFNLGEVASGQGVDLNDSTWRKLNLPHDYSIEGPFDENSPAGTGGGALNGGIGWYRKTFNVPLTSKGKLLFIDFDGVYRNSDVWINGHHLGRRPYGYSSFQYELTPYINFGEENLVAVRVDNSEQPNSRWYSGSGIYRNTWLTTVEPIHVDHWGTWIATPEVTQQAAKVKLETTIKNDSNADTGATLISVILDSRNREVARAKADFKIEKGKSVVVPQELTVKQPRLWSIDQPTLYKAVSEVLVNGHPVDGLISDRYETSFGIRYFNFDVAKGFSLNGTPLKIKGVCNHHDLGALGSAINTRALERQLEMLKAMGVNGIRTSHNPPAPELLELADQMGFIVMDEAFDIWKKEKNKFDYHLDWDEWHKRDLEDLILRDRNHPSVIIWSIGNEVAEQWGSHPEAGIISKELVGIVKNLDRTRPITAACNFVSTDNTLITAGNLDLVGTNYAHAEMHKFPQMFPNRPLIYTETTSSLATRGSYDMPSDQIRRWPPKWDVPLKDGNADFSCSAYDNCSTPWGSTQEETWKLIKKYDFISGMFIWTGWDYIGEPTPYPWPAISSYFGIIDLAGFPKDTFYMYQSEWTTKPMLHIFPHWNWTPGKTVDVWAYFNSDEVELFLNGKSLGTKKKTGDDLHVSWRVPFEPGVLKAVSRRNGKVELTKSISTAGAAARLLLEPDRRLIKADGTDLSFVTVKVVDKNGVVVPLADNLVKFDLSGAGFIAGVDNGNQISHEGFKGKQRKAFHGLAMAIVQTSGKPGPITLNATSEGLASATVTITTR